MPNTSNAKPPSKLRNGLRQFVALMRTSYGLLRSPPDVTRIFTRPSSRSVGSWATTEPSRRASTESRSFPMNTLTSRSSFAPTYVTVIALPGLVSDGETSRMSNLRVSVVSSAPGWAEWRSPADSPSGRAK